MSLFPLKRVPAYVGISEGEEIYLTLKNKQFQCNRLVVSLFSPYVARELMTDANISSIQIPIEDKNNEFSLIIRLMNGFQVDITESNREFVLDVARFFENDELIRKITTINTQVLTHENCIDHLLLKLRSRNSYQNELVYIAKNIRSIDRKQLNILNSDLLYQILCSTDLTIPTEDWLLDLIKYLFEENEEKERIVLLRSIEFNNLSNDYKKQYLELIDLNDNYSWNKVLNTFDKNNDITMSKRYMEEISCPYVKNALNGIFSYIRNKYSLDIIDVEADTNINSTSPKVVISANGMNNWGSIDRPNSSLYIDLGKLKAYVDSYTIKSYGYDKSFSHLKSWVLEGAKFIPNEFQEEEEEEEDIEWIEIDRRVNNYDLNGKWATHTFQCSNPGVYQIFRLRQIGVNHNNTNHMFLSRIEFYGRLLVGTD